MKDEEGIGEEPQDEGLMGRLQSDEKHIKHIWKHIDKKEFRRMVYGYFAEGYLKRCKYIYRKLRKKFKVDGARIDIGDIYALKKQYMDEEPDTSANEDKKATPPPTPLPDKDKELLDKMYADAKASNNTALMRRIEDRMLGKEEEPKSLQDRLVESAIKRLEGEAGGNNNASNKLLEAQQESMINMMKFQNDQMEQLGRARGQGLSGDPGVALAQVVVPTIQEGFHDVNDTIREVGGIRPKERKLRPEDQQKVDQAKQVLLEFEQRRQEYMKCPSCSYVIPKIARQCAACGVVFEPSKEEVTAAALEQKAKGKEVILPKTPEEIARMREAQSETPKVRKGSEAVNKKAKLPEEMKWLDEYFKKDGTLERLRYKIECNHEPKKSMSGAWSLIYPEEQKKLLFVATKGMDFILEAAGPYIDEYGQRELYDFFKTPDAKLWMVRAFSAIRDLAKEDGVILTSVDIKNYESSIKPYIKEPEKMQCGLCNGMILLSEWDKHSPICQKRQMERMEKEALAEAEAKIAEERKKQEQSITQAKV